MTAGPEFAGTIALCIIIFVVLAAIYERRMARQDKEDFDLDHH